MINEKEINEEFERLSALRILTRAYGELASVRMKKSRDSVLYSRIFLADINSIFDDVRASYAREVARLVKRRGLKRRGKITFLAHNGKTAAVLVSANTGLYGDLMKQTFDLFIKEVRSVDVEATIIGKLGRSLFTQAEPTRPYTYFDLPDREIVAEQLAGIIRHLVQYEEIHVFYGKFQNVITQVPSVFNVSAVIPAPEKEFKKRALYLFEPSLEKILVFFETEMFASLFEQVVRESQLAKFASRILAMDIASENIKERMDKVNIERLKLTHRIADKKQLTSYSSISLWKKS